MRATLLFVAASLAACSSGGSTAVTSTSGASSSTTSTSGSGSTSGAATTATSTASGAASTGTSGATSSTSGSSGSASVTGTLAGSTFTAVDVASWSFATGSTTVVLQSTPGVCAAATGNYELAGSTSLTFTFATTGALVPAVYNVPTGTPTIPSVSLLYNVDDSAEGAPCYPTNQENSGSGTVTVSQVTASAITGTFDVTMSNSTDHITGRFDAPNCAGAAIGYDILLDGGVSGCH